MKWAMNLHKEKHKDYYKIELNQISDKREDIITGQLSDINPYYGDLYFSRHDGLDESEYVFIDGNDLKNRIRDVGGLHIGETGFGTGLNFLTLLKIIEERGITGMKLKYSSIEKYPLDPTRIQELLSPFTDRLSELLSTYLSYWESFYPTLNENWNNATWSFPGVEVDFKLYNGDALTWSREKSEPHIDAWFLDGHSPEKNPEIWSPGIMKAVYDNSAIGGTLASFTASGMVKSALREAGFFIKRKKGFGAKRHMIQGLKS